jgi:predicted peroxiredoxin
MAEEKIGLIITHGADTPELTTLPFALANGAIAMDVTPVIILQAEAVRLATKGYADTIHAPGLDPLKKLMDNVLASGHRIMVCAPCVKSRNFAESDLLEGTFIGGAAKVVEALLECVNVVRY